MIHSYPMEWGVLRAVGILVTQVVIRLHALVGHVTQCRPPSVRVRSAASSWRRCTVYKYILDASNIISQLKRQTRTDCKSR